MAQLRRIGKYEILQEIGRGKLAVVYRARDTEADRMVAFKVIHSVFAGQAAFVRRFRQTARIAADLEHPNIVQVYDFDDVGGALYLAMSLIGEGRTLRDLLVEEAPLPPDRALPILTQLADALDYLHSHEPPLTHRDVRPANVLLEQDGDNMHVTLADCGLTGLVQVSTDTSESSPFLGDPAYMAPEQADSQRWGAITPLTDVYALGVIAYEMLTGRAPFTGKTATVLHAHVYDPPPSPLDLTPHLDAYLGEALTRALVKSQAERYSSAGALAAALRSDTTVQVPRERQRARWYDEAAACAGEQRWAEACRAWVSGLRGRPDYLDNEAAKRLLDAVEGLLEQQDEQARQSHEALALFDALATAVEEQNWAKAVEMGQRLVHMAPDLDRPQLWLAHARNELLSQAPISPMPEPRRFGTGDLPPSVILANRYTVLRRIAKGGTGAVYQAQDLQRQGQVVTIKEKSSAAIPPEDRSLAMNSFRRMAEALAQMRHPNLAQVTDHFQAWEHYYIVTEFIQGQTLAQMLEGRREPFPEAQVLIWAAQLCDVLTYLHSQEPPVIYRGLKPGNVMVTGDTDTVKLVSFSIARFYKPGLDKDTHVLGTVGYAAPEQYGAAQTDERTDIYALGVTLHQLLTLRDPATSKFIFPPARQLNPRVSLRMTQAIAKAIQRHPQDRFQTALEMKQALS
ncbi:MAG: serine/threonine protein kinase [Anaerolineae bacterium]|nr:serine/threonine protein kinase [Anaerolineae bacterium]